MSAGLLARLSALVLRNAGFPPREVVTTLDLDRSVAVRLGVKPPVTKTGAGATARSNPSRWSVDKQGFLTIRPKITAACNLMRCRSLALAQPTFPITFEQAVLSYKNKSDSSVLNSSTLPAEKVLKQVAVEVPSRRGAAVGEGLRPCLLVECVICGFTIS